MRAGAGPRRIEKQQGASEPVRPNTTSTTEVVDSKQEDEAEAEKKTRREEEADEKCEQLKVEFRGLFENDSKPDESENENAAMMEDAEKMEGDGQTTVNKTNQEKVKGLGQDGEAARAKDMSDDDMPGWKNDSGDEEDHRRWCEKVIPKRSLKHAGGIGDEPSPDDLASTTAGETQTEAEEGRCLVIRKSPKMPTKAEREAHEATHIPFRSWCEDCVKSRARNKPHFDSKGEDPLEEVKVPRVALDYFFMSKADERASDNPLLVMIDEASGSNVRTSLRCKGARRTRRDGLVNP